MMAIRSWGRLVVVVGSLTAAACAGEAPATQPEPTPDDGTRGTPLITLGMEHREQGLCAASSVGPQPLRRISRVEYNNAVAELFGVTNRPADGFVPEEKASFNNRFNSNIVTPVSELAVEQYLSAAETIADAVATNVGALAGCASAADAACVRAFLTSRARRAWRGTVPAEERDDLLARYDSAVGTLGAEGALKLGVMSVLLSPRFLFIVEEGTGNAGTGPLTGPEVAARLAAVLWRSVPDEGLLAAADAGELATADGVMAEARRMLDDPRADAALADFARQWLDVERAPSLARDNMLWPAFDAALANDLLAESEAFFTSAVRSGAAFDTLMTADYTMANSAIASFYGLNPPAGGGFGRTALPPERRGVLTQGAVLAVHAHFARPSVVLRGRFVRTHLLCDPISPPPANVDTTLKPLAEGQSERDALSAHVTNEQCRACHVRMDPIGNGFEQFDAVGRFIGAAGGTGQGEIAQPAVYAVDDVSGPFTGPVELGQRLAESVHARQCYAVQALRYALGREESSGDACSAAELWSRFSDAGFGLKELIVAITGTDSFRTRFFAQPGGSCQ